MTTVVEIHRNTGAGSFRFASTPIPKETHEDKNGHFQINLYLLFFIPTFILLWKFVIRIVKHLLKKKQKKTPFTDKISHTYIWKIFSSNVRKTVQPQSTSRRHHTYTYTRTFVCNAAAPALPANLACGMTSRSCYSALLYQPTSLSLAHAYIYIYVIPVAKHNRLALT